MLSDSFSVHLCSMLDVVLDRGISVPGCGLWLDASRKKDFAIVTHAHSDHAGWHAQTVLTAATSALMEARLGKPRGSVHELAYNQPQAFEAGQITLLPAGHVLGSAMALLETSGESLLYTGDFKLRQGLTSEPADLVRADTLILETTFGLPRYRFPPAAVVMEKIVTFCEKALLDRQYPVLLAYSLGKAQELIAGLADSGLPIAVHPAVYKMCAIYEKFGVGFPEYERHAVEDRTPKVLIYPPNSRPELSGIPNQRTAIVSGWALDARAKYQFRCDEAFPLSDHADYDELLECVERVRPKRIFTIHGFVEEFASDLRQRGFEAWALGGGNQLEFPFIA
ncbi:MAG: MBL fold metallo-hydrolase RNA specificity domain-containing protein [Verrucomicrobiota bacterium]